MAALCDKILIDVMNITLREIDKKNFEQVGELHIPDEQQKQLSENIWSIAESKFHDTHVARAIYKGDEPVGFIMWVHMSDDLTSIWRFMIAHEHQRQGIGRRALELAIEEIKQEGNSIAAVGICYSPANTVAKNLYFCSGFSEVGISDCGTEAYAQIKLN